MCTYTIALIYFNKNFNLFFSILHVHLAIQLPSATQILIIFSKNPLKMAQSSTKAELHYHFYLH